MPYKDPGKYQAEYRKRKAAEIAAYRADNRERILEVQAAWRAANREKLKKDAKAYAHAHPDRRISYEANRRARRLNQFIEHVDRVLLWSIYGGRCGICDGFIQPEEQFHVDHIIPLSKGGMHGYVNCQPAHPICNLRKSDNV